MKLDKVLCCMFCSLDRAQNTVVVDRHLISSVGRAPVCCAGGRGFEPLTGPTLGVLK